MLVEKGRINFLPESRMLLLESFNYRLHDRLPEELRFILYPVTAAVDRKSPHFPVVQHHGELIGPPQTILFMYQMPQYPCFAD